MSSQIKIRGSRVLKWIAILSFIAYLVFNNRKIGSKQSTPVDQSRVVEEPEIRPETGELEFKR